jgi:hypothetical protein
MHFGGWCKREFILKDFFRERQQCHFGAGDQGSMHASGLCACEIAVFIIADVKALGGRDISRRSERSVKHA